jgi:hypothetical protein
MLLIEATVDELAASTFSYSFPEGCKTIAYTISHS